MSRIKLPGKEKNKKIILIILIIVAIGILSYEASINITSKNIKNENKSQKEMVKPMDIEESYINNTTNTDTDAEETAGDNFKANNNDEKIKVNENEKNYSARENELYNDAYRLFFSHEYANAISKADTLISEFPSNAMLVYRDEQPSTSTNGLRKQHCKGRGKPQLSGSEDRQHRSAGK